MTSLERVVMRPNELTLEGFRSYRESQTFTFDSRGLFGIVGATGAGKSSILDAIIFALYGKTPKVERDTHTLINSSHDEARISLHFQVDDAVWEVNRVIRAKGAAQVVLKRDDGSLEASGARAVTDRITELVGLDFSAFCSSVVLPQGSFDDFLKATPAQRTRILKGLFRLERVDLMRAKAKEQLDELEVESKALQAHLDQMPDDPEGLLTKLSLDKKTAKKRAADLEKGAQQISALKKVLEQSGRDLQSTVSETDLVKSASSGIPKPADIESLASAEGLIRSEIVQLETNRTKAKGGVETSSKELEKVERTLGADLERADHLLRDFKRSLTLVDAASKKLAAIKKGFEQTSSSLEAQKNDWAATEAAVEQARAKLEEAHRAHAAHLLRGGLQTGEVCPVCEQEVKRVPKTTRPPAIARLDQALNRSKVDSQKSKALLDQLVREHSGAEAQLTAIADQLKAATRERDDAIQQLAATLGKDVDFEQEIGRRESAVRQARALKERADENLKVLERKVAEVKERLEATAERRRRIAVLLIKICATLKIESPSIDDDADAILGAAKKATESASLRMAELVNNKSELDSSITATKIDIDNMLTDLGVDRGSTVAQILSRANETVGGLNVRIEELTKAIKLQSEIHGRAKTVNEKQDLYRRLTTDLTDSRFTAYLLAEQKRLLSRIGSEKFYELTQRYRFDEEGNFQIHDVGMGVLRPPDTLSGGETFLASLALALALADAVSEGGSRLECLFLDEGFAYLDRNSLDLALDGIESLAIPGRLIGIISHVPEIQVRIDDLIVLDKNDDGSTKVLQTEGPIGYHTPLV